ncbi:DNA repair protein XRCC4-like isoform X2 [Pyrus x bretschneideri]|uniref:DNA repair protein XRCC4-like isoform X2 n=1 Tax=Pyrus x bretschneideri TaxID=225117 RepID=UPI002030386B|nr:DNA repair protein XRCC4-like isoform X2 [Pyrus x bretschneideri]
MEAPTPKHTCLKLELQDSQQPIFVKGTWFPSRFELSITDGLNAWICSASEDQVRDRAAQWDQPVSEYLALAERYLGFQHPDSVYGFAGAGDGYKRLSWTFEKEGTKLEWRWKCQPSPNSKQTTAAVLDFLMDANVGLSFLGVLNSKKAKLRELRDKLSNKEVAGKLPEEEEVSSEQTEPYVSGDDKSEEECLKNYPATSKDVPSISSRGRGRKRGTHK